MKNIVRINNTKREKQFSTFLVLLFLLLSNFGLFASNYQDVLREEENSINLVQDLAESDHYFKYDFSFPYHQPSESPEPIATEEESKENTNERDSHDADAELGVSSEHDLKLNTTKICLKQLKQLLDNKKRISLILLYHSWKSFLI